MAQLHTALPSAMAIISVGMIAIAGCTNSTSVKPTTRSHSAPTSVSLSFDNPQEDAKALVPGVSWTIDASPKDKVATYSFSIRNESSQPITVSHVGASGPSLKLVSTKPKSRFTVAGWKSEQVSVTYRVEKCAKSTVADNHWDLPVSLSSGAMAHLDLPARSPSDSWQAAIVDSVCS